MPVPPRLEEALGYHGSQRLVAFYWHQAHGALAWLDGRHHVLDGHWPAWLLFTSHPGVSGFLEPFFFGDPASPARDWLLLDRDDGRRRLYAGPVHLARAVFSDAFGTIPDPEAAPASILDQLRLTDVADFEVAFEAISQSHEFLDRQLRDWLNSHLHQPGRSSQCGK